MKTRWTDGRLKRLYTHYNRKFWNDKLPDYHVCQETIPDGRSVAYEELRSRRIVIDVEQHQSDREIRSTLLHEMVHVAAGPGTGHDSAFFTQLERLLRMKAPINMELPENENRPSLETVPARFKLCRRALKAHYERQHKWLESELKSSPEESLEELFLERVEQAATHGKTWKEALVYAGRKLGMLDIDDKPLPRVRPWLKSAREAFCEGLQRYRDIEVYKQFGNKGKQ